MNMASQIMGGAAFGYQAPRPRMRYSFYADPKRPGYIQIADNLRREQCGEMIEEHASVVCMMYETMWHQNPRAADEFLYGHNLGVTMAQLHADKYSKIEKFERDGKKWLRLTDAVTGTVKEWVPAEAQGKVAEMMGEMVQKAGMGPKSGDNIN